MRDVVIVAGARTPVGAFGGSLKTTPVVQLGALVLKETLKKAGLRPFATEGLTKYEPDSLKGTGMVELEKEAYDYDESLQPVQIDEVIMGNVVGAGQGQNVARQATIRGGISKETGAFTINKVCASGMKAIALGAQAIGCGAADVILIQNGTGRYNRRQVLAVPDNDLTSDCHVFLKMYISVDGQGFTIL